MTEPIILNIKKKILDKNDQLAQDLRAYGEALKANTEGQANLHPELVSPEARRVIETAQEYGAWAWKVNGAGGSGGSVALLCGPQMDLKRQLLATLKTGSSSFVPIPVRLDSEGLTTWITPMQ